MKLLVRHFVNCFFIGDWVTPGGDLRALAITLGAWFASPGIIVSLFLALAGGFVDDTPEVAFLFALSMVLIGLATMFAWDQLLPDRIDFLILRPLPLPSRTILFAKLGALGWMFGYLILIVNIVSAWLLTAMGTSNVAPMSFPSMAAHWAWYANAQLLAAAAGCAWVFLTVLALQALALLLGGQRGRALLRFPLMVALLIALALTPNLLSPPLYRKAMIAVSPSANPLAWFVGLNAWWSGHANMAQRAAAHRSLIALAATAALALALYVAAYVRIARELPPVGRARPTRRIAIHHALAPSGSRPQAVATFAWATLRRSPRHRLYLSMWLSLAVALAIEGLITGGNAAPTPVLAVPLIVMFFVLLGMRHVYAIPIQSEAGWIFRLADGPGQADRFTVAERLMLGLAVVPLAVLALPWTAHHWGSWPAVAQLALDGALGWALAELLLLRFNKVPFTCSYLPDKANSKLTWIVGWLAFTVYVYQTAVAEPGLWARPLRWALVVGVAALVAATLAAERRRWLASGVACIFDDVPDPIVQTLFPRD